MGERGLRMPRPHEPRIQDRDEDRTEARGLFGQIP